MLSKKIKGLARAIRGIVLPVTQQTITSLEAFSELEEAYANIRKVARSVDTEDAISCVKSAATREIESSFAKPWEPVPAVAIARFLCRRLSEGEELDDANVFVRTWLGTVRQFRSAALVVGDTTAWEKWAPFAEALSTSRGSP